MSECRSVSVFPQRERQPWPSKGKEQSDLDSAQTTFINIGMLFYLSGNMTHCDVPEQPIHKRVVEAHADKYNDDGDDVDDNDDDGHHMDQQLLHQ